MTTLTTEQMAELLLGMARAQLAMVDAMESAKAGFKSTHLRNQVESAARIKVNRPESLSDFPSRLLLQMLGRNAPTLEGVTAELQRLISSAAAGAAAGSGESAGGDAAGSLDMTK